MDASIKPGDYEEMCDCYQCGPHTEYLKAQREAEKLKPLPVAGYTAQKPEAVRLVNFNKRMEEIALRHLDELKTLEMVDQRWLAIGRTHIEEAFMAINRSIFKPQRVRLEDGV